MIGDVGASPTEIYHAVLALSRSIAGRTGLDALLSGVAEALKKIVNFDHVGLILHDPNRKRHAGVHSERAWKSRHQKPSACRSTRIPPVGYG